jgi:hypothetical protein
MAIYYLNGTTLENSTSIYTDAALTTCASDGFYADGSGIVRELSGCILGPVQTCPTCLTACGGGPINYVSTYPTCPQCDGVFLLNVDLGDTVTDVGAVLVKFTPASIPDGIKATYNGVSYNKLSSPVDGYHGGTVSNGYTYVGDSGATCVPVAGTTYSGLTKYRYNGTSFVDTGTTENITPQAGELSFSSSAPGTLVMVIPKVSQSIKELNIEISGVCEATGFTIEVDCPVLLTGYSSSVVGPDFPTACGYVIGETYYNAPVSGTAGNPAVNDWVFSDAYGENVLAQGFYKINATEYIEVDANGIVITRANC